MLVFLIILLLIIFSGSTLFSQFYIVPPFNWKEKILASLNSEIPVYIPVSKKVASVRRRLILASLNPSFHNNFINEKLKIFPGDKNDKEKFMHKLTIRDPNDPNRKKIFGFFHPYADAGGGGERVLWAAVESTLSTSDSNIVAIYTGDCKVEPKKILENVFKKFQIDLNEERIVFIYLKKRHLIDPLHWPRFTLLGQAFGSFLLALEAICSLCPDVWIDTVGLPFSYPLVRFVLKVPIMSYVHYPIIQQDMINKLKFNKVQDILKFNSVKDFRILGKFLYWSIFQKVYTLVGSQVDITLTNSTWTYNHIEKIWNLNDKIDIVYPPCGTESIMSKRVRSKPSERENSILCIAQFRSEKRHDLIIKEYSKFYERAINSEAKTPKLILLGSIRSDNDRETVEKLKTLAETLNIPSEKIEFILDAKYDLMLDKLASCKFGINAMWNEHFGISVVEYMASGLIPLVHASAGPLFDIVVPWDLQNDSESNSTRNKSGFFFKAIEDPDFKDQIQKQDTADFSKLSELQFLNSKNGEIETFFTLSKLFEHISSIDDAELDLISERGEKIVMSKFSNLKFMKQWEGYIEELTLLEIEKRNTKGKVEKVF